MHKELNACGFEFLQRQLIFNSKCARAYDEDGRRYGHVGWSTTRNVDHTTSAWMCGAVRMGATQ
jgi:hypothetical protein